MSKRNDDFFAVKKDWSRVKDTLLGSYLHVYFSKVIHTGKPIVYIDCFAGAGRFGDGEDGSPRIALSERKAAIERSKYCDPKIDMYFIEPLYAAELESNISDFVCDAGHGRIQVLKDTYENAVPKILSGLRSVNVFLYVDPFGIKYLGNRIFVDACKNFNGNVELLLNLNSFGFIREACRVMGTAYKGEEVELEEREECVVDKNSESERLMSKIAGGDYWKRIIAEYRSDNTDTSKSSLKAEKDFAAIYKHTLSKLGGGPFSYVLDIPIRIKEGSYPKYRMVHATNHPDGCIEMADNMIRRAGELYRDIQSHKQQSLFEFDVNQEIKAPESLVREGLVRVICKQSDALIEKIQKWGLKYTKSADSGTIPMRLHQILASFFCSNGIICSKKDVLDVLKKMEIDGLIAVSRNPVQTPHGAPSKFWSDDKGKMVFIKFKGL